MASGLTHMYVFEPCNYASNIAYYHASTRLCDFSENFTLGDDYRREFIRAFSNLALGSAMWHASHTYVGYSFDNQ